MRFNTQLIDNEPFGLLPSHKEGIQQISLKVCGKCLSRCSAVKRHHGNTFIKGSIIRAGLQVQRLSPIDRGEERGSRQADYVLLRVLHMDLQTAK